MFRIGKFEWKILAALLVTAATPLVFTATIVNRLVRDSMAVGVNDRVLGGLRTGVELYKQVVELKLKLARVQAELLMGDKHFVEALKDGNTGYLEQRLEGVVAASEIVAEARLFARGELVASASRVGDFSPKKYKSKTESWSLEGDARLEFDLAMERDFLESSARLRDLVETLDQLKKNFGPWQMAYYRLFLFIYVWILAISVVVAILLARSVTKRVSRLVQATMQAAAGNLDIRVPVRGRDEIGHLSASFNLMLDEIRRSRDRIVYLEKISAWQGMAQRLAHEIKNPLTPIQLAVQELHRSYRGGDDDFRRKLDDSLEIVEEEVATLRRLVENFTEFARTPELQLEKVEINGYLKDLIKHNPHLASRLEFVGGPQAHLWLDRVMMGRAIINLVRNGIEASEKGQKVRLSATADENWVTVSVKDRGAGLSDEARAKLFQPYFTTKPDGTGLGLAIVKRIVVQHGGEIRVRDGNPSGTVFEIRLSRLEPERAGAAVEGRR